MAIAFHCPQCSAAIQVPDSASGKRGTCPSCKVKVLVPVIEIPATPVPDAGTSPQPPETVASPQPPGEPASPAAPATPGGFIAPDPVAPQFPAVTQPAGSDAPVFPGAGGAAPGPTAPAPLAANPPADPFPGPLDNAPAVPAAPVVQAPVPSIAARTRRRSKKKKSGTLFAVVCGVALSAGVGWLYLNSGPDLEKARIAYTAPDVLLPPKVVDNALIEVPEEVRRAVLLYFEENPERLRSDLVETEFRGSSEGLEVRILAGLQTMLYRVPLDPDLEEWRDENLVELDQPRLALLKKSIKLFFEDWDVAIRNQTGIEDFQSYRDRVGLTAAVGAFGYHVTAMIGTTQYPCIYENKDGIYFLLPRDTKSFRVAGDRTDDRPSLFPGEFEVVVRKGKTPRPPVETESSDPEPSNDEDRKDPVKPMRESEDE